MTFNTFKQYFVQSAKKKKNNLKIIVQHKHIFRHLLVRDIIIMKRFFLAFEHIEQLCINCQTLSQLCSFATRIDLKISSLFIGARLSLPSLIRLIVRAVFIVVRELVSTVYLDQQISFHPKNAFLFLVNCRVFLIILSHF